MQPFFFSTLSVKQVLGKPPYHTNKSLKYLFSESKHSEDKINFPWSPPPLPENEKLNLSKYGIRTYWCFFHAIHGHSSYIACRYRQTYINIYLQQSCTTDSLAQGLTFYLYTDFTVRVYVINCNQ